MSSAPIADHGEALRLMRQLFAEPGCRSGRVALVAVGHRVVHGGAGFGDPTLIDDAVVAEIARLVAAGSAAQPGERDRHRAWRGSSSPDIPHVAVFDTASSTRCLRPRATYAIDRELAQQHDIRRYGFHGTSHQYVSPAGGRVPGP